MENNYFDNAVRDAISDYDSSFPSNWEEMESRLDADTHTRRKLYITKGIELCLMVFAIWTVVHMVQGEGLFNSTNDNISNVEPSSTIVPPIEENENENISKEIVPLPVENTVEQTTEQAVLEGVPIAGAIPSEENVATPFVSNIEQNVTDFSTVKNDFIEKNLHQTQNLLIQQPIASQTDLHNERALVAFNDWSYLENIQLNALNNDASKIKPLNILQPTANAKLTGRKSNQKFRLTPMASLDWFNVKTPAVAGVTKKPQNINAGGGVMVDVKLSNRLRFETGLAFSKRVHQERVYAAMMDNRAIEETKSTLSTNTLEVPTHLKYEIGNVNGKNHLYVLGGVSNHLVASIKNQVEEQNTFANAIFNDPKQSPQREPIIDNLTTSNYTTNDVTPDPNSNLSNNHYLSVNAGVGYERQITKRLSIFGQILYKHGTKPVGKDEELISSISISTGLRGSL